MFLQIKKIWSSLEENERKNLRAGFLFILSCAGIFIFILPFLFVLPAPFKFMDFSNKGSVGDTINGISGPFIALLGALLTFLAFYIQYKANEQQRDFFLTELKRQEVANKRQSETWEIERFESKFFEMLQLHREIVREMNIADLYFGRKCFIPMFNEFQYLYYVVKYKLEDRKDLLNMSFPVDKLSDLAFKLFFWGIGESSDKIVDDKLSEADKEFVKAIRIELRLVQMQYYELDAKKIAPYFQINRDIFFEFTPNYFPFDGHASRLGIYFRHLLYTVRYVDSFDSEVLDDDKKMQYIKILRNQLSNHEQLMLYYNALSELGSKWLLNSEVKIFSGYIGKYRLIHNIPLPLADFGKLPQDTFKKDIELWKNNVPPKTFFEGG